MGNLLAHIGRIGGLALWTWEPTCRCIPWGKSWDHSRLSVSCLVCGMHFDDACKFFTPERYPTSPWRIVWCIYWRIGFPNIFYLRFPKSLRIKPTTMQNRCSKKRRPNYAKQHQTRCNNYPVCTHDPFKVHSKSIHKSMSKNVRPKIDRMVPGSSG